MITFRKKFLIAGSISVLLGANTQGSVVAYLEVPTSDTSPQRVAGDQLDVLLYFESSQSIAAAEMEVHCSADTVRIVRITFSEAFPLLLKNDAAELPAQDYSAARGRSLDDLAGAADADTTAFQFATIQVEVTTDTPFQAAVEITVRAAVVGSQQEPTAIRTSDGRESASGTIRIPIQSLGAPDGQPGESGALPDDYGGTSGTGTDGSPGATDEEEPAPLVELDLPPSAAVTLQVVPVGSDQPVSVLEAGSAYELHFDAADTPIHGYSGKRAPGPWV